MVPAYKDVYGDAWAASGIMILKEASLSEDIEDMGTKELTISGEMQRCNPTSKRA